MPFDPTRSLPHAALAAALNLILGESDSAKSTGVPGSAAFGKRQRTDERTLYLVADPDHLTGLVSERRILVLPKSFDLALLSKHPSFPIFMPMHVSLRVLDARHAEVDHDRGGAGGMLALDLRDGVWRVASLLDWAN